MAKSTRILFRVLYAAFYSLLHLLLVALLLVSPADIINQSRSRHDIVSILIVSASFVASVLVVVFVFFLRLFLNRAILNSIPKAWLPTETGDMRKPVRRMIHAGLSRSAAIAYVSRPRIFPAELFDEICPLLMGGGMAGGTVVGGGGRAAESGRGAAVDAVDDADAVDAIDSAHSSRSSHTAPESLEKADQTDEREGRVTWAVDAAPDRSDTARRQVPARRTETVEMEKKLGIDLPPCLAVWGTIEHPGWAPPHQPLLAAWARGGIGGGRPSLGDPAAAAAAVTDADVGLQYGTVVAELPNLLEAKALTLAPPDPIMMTTMAPSGGTEPPLLDVDMVALLQRPAHMGLREYLAYLAELGVVNMDEADSNGDGNEDGSGYADSDPRPLRVIVPAFVATYEYARFSTEMLMYDAFQQLMHDLATILRRMQPPDPEHLLYDSDGDDYGDSYSASYGNGYGYDHDNSYVGYDGSGGDRNADAPYPPYDQRDSSRCGRLSNDSDEDTDETDEVDEIDNNMAQSSPTMSPRSRERREDAIRSRQRQRQQQQQQPPQSRTYAPVTRDASQLSRSQSAGSGGWICTSATISMSSSNSSNGSDSRRRQDTDDASRRRLGVADSATRPWPAPSSTPRAQSGRTTTAARHARPRRPGVSRPASSGSSSSIGRDSARSTRSIKSTRSTRSTRTTRSISSVVQTRHPYVIGSQPSDASLSSTTSSGSVIRLVDRTEMSRGRLPYVIMTPPPQDRSPGVF